MVCAQSQPASDLSSGPSNVAAVPRLIKFSGAVRDARGEPLGNVAVRLTFAVYSEQQGGAALWIESQVAQLDEQGRYAVLLGATRADGLPVELFPGGKARWLGVQVEGRDEDPRVLLVSVPYALKAEDAAMLGGRTASDFVLAEQLKEEVRTQVAAQTPGIATQAVEMLVSNPPKAPAIAEGPSTFTCATTGNCVTVQQNGTGRAMSTSAVSSTDVVLVQQTGTGYGLRALAPGNVAVYGQITGSAGTSYGVKGLTTSTTGAGVYGYNLAATSSAYGVLGQTKSTAGAAVFGRALAATGNTVGVLGAADSPNGVGVMGRMTRDSGPTIGVQAKVSSPDGTALVVDNTAGGKLVSAQVNGTEKFKVDGSGSVYANTYLDLAGNPIGSGSSNDLNCDACVSEPEVSFNYAGSSSQGGAATSALSADAATTAATATNALSLGGVAAANYARWDTANNFVGDQAITGNLTLTGTVNGVTITPSMTRTCTMNNSIATCLSANILGGYTGLGGGSGGSSLASGVLRGKSLTLAAVGGNTIADGVAGGTISGGGGTVDGASYAVKVTNHWGTVAGGALNQAGDNNDPGTGGCCQSVGGGMRNIAGGGIATIAGGYGNEASDSWTTVGGGGLNIASGSSATVGGGISNKASKRLSTVGGGLQNTASGDYATVGGGMMNEASGLYATIGGGFINRASGENSFAAGCLANAVNDGAFVWSGGSVNNCLSATSWVAGQFLAVAPGGVVFYSNAAHSTGVSLPPGGGSWSSVSDRNAKEKFQPANGEALLARLNEIPILTWNYKAQDASIRHIGPMAQDFYAAFQVGEDDRHISTVDADGVALAGVQALYQLSQEKDRVIKAQGEKIEQLAREVDDLRARLAGLEQAVLTR
jgi:hypothetical protein